MTVGFWRIVSAVTVWHIAASLCYYAIYAGTPLFRDAFDLTGLEVGFVITALTLGYAVFLLPIGVVTDRFGEHRTLTAGLVGLSLGVIAVVLAPTYPSLLGAVFLLGSAYGSATPGTNKAIFERIEPGRQHRAIGIKQIGPTVGSAISAVLVTGVAGVLVWQSGFLLVATIGLVIAGSFYVVYRPGERTQASYPDFRGLLASRTYTVLLLVGVCLGSAFYTTTGYTVLFVNESVGATVAMGGIVLAALQLSSSVGKVLAGGLADVLPGASRVTTSAMIAVQTLGGGILFLLLPRVDTPLAAGVVVAGLGVSVLGSSGLYFSCVSTIVAEDELGAASAAAQLALTVSGLFAPPTFGYLVDTSGYGAAWAFLGGVSFLATALVTIVVFDG